MADNTPETINMADWYTPEQAAERLSQNSGKPIKAAYPRQLARLGKVRTHRIGRYAVLYWRTDIDGYVVEERGAKSGRAKQEKARRYQ